VANRPHTPLLLPEGEHLDLEVEAGPEWRGDEAKQEGQEVGHGGGP